MGSLLRKDPVSTGYDGGAGANALSVPFALRQVDLDPLRQQQSGREDKGFVT